MSLAAPEDRARAARGSAAKAALVAVGMLGLAFAAVPAYDLFCRVTGFGGTPLQSDTTADKVLDRVITVRFDANTAPDMGWVFEPVERQQQIRLGETGLAFYRAHNPTDKPITGSASFNVAPYNMGGYFVKIDCFCFQEQTLQPGQSIDMPVTYYVDPELVEDDEAGETKLVTLSYTFYPMEPTASAETARRGDEG